MARTINIGETTYVVNSDFSGDVKIESKDKEIEVPFKNLYYFFVEYARQTLEIKIENKLDGAAPNELLRMLFSGTITIK